MTIKVSRPSPLDRFEKSEHIGHDVAFIGAKAEELDTAFGPADVAHCTGVLCVTCRRGWPDVVIFGTALVPRITSGDSVVAGILVQGEAKPGRQPPWLLDDPDDDQLDEVQALVDTVVTQLASGRLVVDFDLLEDEERF